MEYSNAASDACGNQAESGGLDSMVGPLASRCAYFSPMQFA